MDNTIYIILGVVAAIYLAISILNRNKSKSRKGRRFMGDYKRKDTKE